MSAWRVIFHQLFPTFGKSLYITFNFLGLLYSKIESLSLWKQASVIRSCIKYRAERTERSTAKSKWITQLIYNLSACKEVVRFVSQYSGSAWLNNAVIWAYGFILFIIFRSCSHVCSRWRVEVSNSQIVQDIKVGQGHDSKSIGLYARPQRKSNEIWMKEAPKTRLLLLPPPPPLYQSRQHPHPSVHHSPFPHPQIHYYPPTLSSSTSSSQPLHPAVTECQIFHLLSKLSVHLVMLRHAGCL